MKLCRFQCAGESAVRIGRIVEDARVVDWSAAGVSSLSGLLENAETLEQWTGRSEEGLPVRALSEVRLLAPVERQEVWAAGVTYLRSKTARMEESEFSANAYDRVYEAPRPELFFKSLPEKVVGPDEPVGVRRDSKWNVPEPELALVLNSKGAIAGYTIGNDMSSRDIEGENLLYLPQAKVYSRSCALGAAVVVGVSEQAARDWTIRLEIERDGRRVFDGETKVNQIKRPFAELAEYLYRSQEFPDGAVLLTGTGVVPPDDFSLCAGDAVSIRISGIGVLRNAVIEV